MICSLGEVESLARKASKGAGMPWGIAEDAGKATRWLCAAGLPGGELLAVLLHQNDGFDYARLRPVDTGAHLWRAQGGALCPLIAGAALCDRAQPGLDLAMARLSCPLLLAPYMVMTADHSGHGLCLTWEGARIMRTSEGTFLDATPEALSLPEAQSVAISPIEKGVGQHMRRGYRGDISARAMEALEAFAHRTYAPETEGSRLTGAGAGLSDND